MRKCILPALVFVAAAILAGCESNSDVVEDGQTGEVFALSPSSVALTDAEKDVLLTIEGGVAPFTVELSDTTQGNLTGISNSFTEGSIVAYHHTGTSLGGNVVTVTDSRGWQATCTITYSPRNTLALVPSVVTMTTNDTDQAFIVQGGAGPYTWSVDSLLLGHISFASGTTGIYQRVEGLAGPNTVRVVDGLGESAEATVLQE